MRADLHDVEITLGPLVRTVASLEETVRHLDKRVARLEEQGLVLLEANVCPLKDSLV